MNVSRSTQFELVLFIRTLNILKSTPGLSLTTLFNQILPYLKSLPNRSLSAYWKEKNQDGISLVCEKEEPKTTDSESKQQTLPSNIRELEHLKNAEHTEARHDPLLIVRTLYESASQELQYNTSADERCVLLQTCLCIAIKTGRLSILLHSLLLVYMYDHDSKNIDPTILQEFYSTCREFGLSQIQKASKNPTTLSNLLKEENIQDIKQVNGNNLVLSFGKADHGKLGLGDVQLNRFIPTMIDQLVNCQIFKVVSMSTYCLAISKVGKVYIWGTGGNAAAANASSHPASSRLDIRPQILDALSPKLSIIDIACGLGHTLFLTALGKVYAWGNGGNGRLGLGDLHDRNEACFITTLQDEIVSQVVCGASHSLALTNKGQVYAWGKNTQGQCGQGNIEDQLKPAAIKRLSEVTIVQITAGWEHSIALTNEGKMYSWGCGYKDNRRGIIPPVLGLGHSECRPLPELISSMESVKIVSIASGWDHCLALDENGKLLSWGSGQNGKLGHNNEDNISIPCYVNSLEHVKIVSYSAGCEHSAAISEDGKLYMWGHGEGGRLGMGNNAPSLTPTVLSILPSMNIRPHFVHCGDKFTVIISQPLVVNIDSVNIIRSMHSMKNYWKLSDIQEMFVDRIQSSKTLIAEDSARRMRVYAIEHTERIAHNLLTQPLNDQEEVVPDRNIDILLSMLYSMILSFGNRVVEGIPVNRAAISFTFESFPSILHREQLVQKYCQYELDDVEYSVECSEDSYYLFSTYLEIFLPYYSKSLNDMIQFFQNIKATQESNSYEGSEQTSSDGQDSSLMFFTTLQNAFYSSPKGTVVDDTDEIAMPITWQQSQTVLFHILLLTSMNIHVLANLYKRQQEELHEEEMMLLDSDMLLEQSSKDSDDNSEAEVATGTAGEMEKLVMKKQKEIKKKLEEKRSKKKTVWDLKFIQNPRDHATQDDKGHKETDSRAGSNGSNPEDQEFSNAGDGGGYDEDDGLHSEYTEDENRKRHNGHRKQLRHRRGDNHDEEDDEEDDDLIDGDDEMLGDDDDGNDGDLETSVDSSVISAADQRYDSPIPRPFSASANGVSFHEQHSLMQSIAMSEVNNSLVMPVSLSTTTLTFPDLSNALPKPSSAASQQLAEERRHSHVSEKSDGFEFMPTTLSPSMSFESLQQALEDSNGGDFTGNLNRTRADSSKLDELSVMEVNKGDLLMESVATVSGFSQYLTEENPTASEVGEGNSTTGVMTNGVENSALDLLVDEDEEDEDLLDYYDPDLESVQLQELLLEQMQQGPSPMTILNSIPFRKDVPLSLLQSIAIHRQGDYLAKLRNQINTISSVSYLCIQQCYSYLVNSLIPSIVSHSKPMEASSWAQINGFVTSLYQSWELTQLITYSGYEMLYDRLEQQSVLLQIIQSPTSFLYIIPGIMYGNYKKPIAAYQELLISFFDMNKRDEFFHASRESQSNHRDEYQNEAAKRSIENIDKETKKEEQANRPLLTNISANEPSQKVTKKKAPPNYPHSNRRDAPHYQQNEDNYQSEDDDGSIHSGFHTSRSSHNSHRSPSPSPRERSSSSGSSSNNSGESESLNYLTIYDLIQLLLQLKNLYADNPANTSISSSSSSQVLKEKLPFVHELKVLLHQHIQTSFSTFIASLLSIPLSWYFSSNPKTALHAFTFGKKNKSRSHSCDSGDGLPSEEDDEDESDHFPWNKNIEYFFSLIFECIYLDVRDHLELNEKHSTPGNNFQSNEQEFSPVYGECFAVIMINCLFPVQNLQYKPFSQDNLDQPSYTFFMQYLTMVMPMVKQLLSKLQSIEKKCQTSNKLDNHSLLSRIWDNLCQYLVYYYRHISPLTNSVTQLFDTIHNRADAMLRTDSIAKSVYRLKLVRFSWKKLRVYLNIDPQLFDGTVSDPNQNIVDWKRQTTLKEWIWLWSLWQSQFHKDILDVDGNISEKREFSDNNEFTTFSPVTQTVSSERRWSKDNVFGSGVLQRQHRQCINDLIGELLSHQVIQSLPLKDSDLPVLWFRDYCKRFAESNGCVGKDTHEQSIVHACMSMYIQSFSKQLSISLLIQDFSSTPDENLSKYQLSKFDSKSQALLLSWVCSSLIICALLINKYSIFVGFPKPDSVLNGSNKHYFNDHEIIDLLHTFLWEEKRIGNFELVGISQPKQLAALFQEDITQLLAQIDGAGNLMGEPKTNAQLYGLMMHILEAVNALQKEITTLLLPNYSTGDPLSKATIFSESWPGSTGPTNSSTSLNAFDGMTSMEVMIRHSIELQVLNFILFPDDTFQYILWEDLLRRQLSFSIEWFLFALQRTAFQPKVLTKFFSLYFSQCSNTLPLSAMQLYNSQMPLFEVGNVQNSNFSLTSSSVETVIHVLQSAVSDLRHLAHQLTAKSVAMGNKLSENQLASEVVWQFTAIPSVQIESDKNSLFRQCEGFRRKCTQYHVLLQCLFQLFSNCTPQNSKLDSYNSDSVPISSNSSTSIVNSAVSASLDAWDCIMEQYTTVYESLYRTLLSFSKHAADSSSVVTKQLLFYELSHISHDSFSMIEWLFYSNHPLGIETLLSTSSDAGRSVFDSRLKLYQKSFQLLDCMQHSYEYFYSKSLSHLSACQHSFVTYLYNSLSSSVASNSFSSSTTLSSNGAYHLEMQSPMLFANLYTPNGHCGLSFWFYLPSAAFTSKVIPTATSQGEVQKDRLTHIETLPTDEIREKIAKQMKENLTSDPTIFEERIHLMTRYPETNDVHMVELLTSQLPTSMDNYTLSVYVVHTIKYEAATDSKSANSAGERFVHSFSLEIHMIVYQFESLSPFELKFMRTDKNLNQNQSTLRKVNKRIYFRTEPLILNTWMQCVIDIQQSFLPPLRPDPAQSQSGATFMSTASSSTIISNIFASRPGTANLASGSGSRPGSSRPGSRSGPLGSTGSANNNNSEPSSPTNPPSVPGSNFDSISNAVMNGESNTTTGGNCTGEELTKVKIFINGECVAKEESLGGKWPLHQHIVVGKLPTALGQNVTNPAMTTDPIQSVASIALTDVLWIPTSLPNDNLHSQYDFNSLYLHYLRGMTRPVVSCTPYLRSSTKDKGPTTSGWLGGNTIYPLTTAHPPSHMLSFLNLHNELYLTCFYQYNLLLRSMNDENQTFKSSIQSFFSHHLLKSLQLIHGLLPICNTNTQSILLSFFQSLWSSFPEYIPYLLSTPISEPNSANVSSNNSNTNSPDRIAMVTSKGSQTPFTSTAGSAFHAALHHKIGQEFIDLLKLCLTCVASFLPSTGQLSISSPNQVGQFESIWQEYIQTMSSVAAMENGSHSSQPSDILWKLRVLLYNTNNAVNMNVLDWYPHIINISESLISQQVIVIFSTVIQLLCQYFDTPGSFGNISNNGSKLDKIFVELKQSLCLSSNISSSNAKNFEHAYTVVWLGYHGGYFPQLQSYANVTIAPSRYYAFPANSTGVSNNPSVSMTYQQVSQQIMFPTTFQVKPIISTANQASMSRTINSNRSSTCPAKLSYKIDISTNTSGYDVAFALNKSKASNESVFSNQAIPLYSPLDQNNISSVLCNDMLLSNIKSQMISGRSVEDKDSQLLSTKLASSTLLSSTALISLLQKLWQIGKKSSDTNVIGMNSSAANNLSGKHKTNSKQQKSLQSLSAGSNENIEISKAGSTINSAIGNGDSTSKSASSGSKKSLRSNSTPTSPNTAVSPVNPFLQMFYLVATLRSVALQFSNAYDRLASSNSKDSIESFWNMIQPFLSTSSTNSMSLLSMIASIATIDTKQSIYQCLDPVNPLFVHHHLSPQNPNSNKDNSIKGIQLDVIRNLLKETDIHFLEQLSLTHWSYFNMFPLSQAWQSQIIFESYYTQYDNTLLQLIPIAGDVMITGSNSKIKAVSHFPSVKLAGVNLMKQSGRWYYECTLLSDGLIQIGWANSHFKCDPICGQGVGDHIQSWAYDGLRMKKWNVSCESYGKRWKAGDVVGILVDMDLLEMKFFLNGEDLGVAFEDFHGDLFPAVSLNVRQSIRLNFGQGKFLYPPYLLDGYPYKPIIYALTHPMNGKTFKQQLPNSSTTPSKSTTADAVPKTGSSTAGSKTVTFQDSTVPVNGTEGADAILASTNSTNNERINQRTPVLYIDNGTTLPLVSTPSANALSDDNDTVVGDASVSNAAADIFVVNHDDDASLTEQKHSENSSSSTNLLPNIQELEHEVQRQIRAISANSEPSPMMQDSISTASLQQRDDREFGNNEYDEEPSPYMLQGSAHWQQEDLESRTRMEVETEPDDYEEEDEDDEEEEDGDGEEEEEEEEDDEDDERGEGGGRNAETGEETQNDSRRRRRRLSGDNDETNEDDEDDGEEEEGDDNHMMEIRQQALIESLVGMGFPVDWALRAAEQCDVTTSESAAIAWILERMEMEQNKLNELDGDSSSRAGGGDDYDELDNSHMSSPGLEYFMQRHAGNMGNGSGSGSAGTSANVGTSASSNATSLLNTFSQELRSLNLLNRHMVTEEMVELLESAAQQLQQEANITNTAGEGSGTSSAYSPGSPPREDFFQFLQASSRQFAALAGGSNSGSANSISGGGVSENSTNSHQSNLGMGATAHGESTYAQYLANQFNVISNAGKKFGSKEGEFAHAGNEFNAIGGGTSHATTSGLPANSHDIVYQDFQSTWNLPVNHATGLVHRYSPILPGYSLLPFRHDLEKQEVLWQVEELDLVERMAMLFICEWLLTIYYARMIIYRIVQFQLHCTQLPSRTTVVSLKDPDTDNKVESNDLFLGDLLFDITLSLFPTPGKCFNYFQYFFTQQVLSSASTNTSMLSLSPVIAYGNLIGDVEVKLPPCYPFYASHECRWYDELHKLEKFIAATSGENKFEKEHIENELGITTSLAFYDWLKQLCLIVYESTASHSSGATTERTNTKNSPDNSTADDSHRSSQYFGDKRSTLAAQILTYFIQQSILYFELAHSATTTGISSTTSMGTVPTGQSSSSFPYHISLPENMDWLMTSIDKHATIHDLYVPSSISVPAGFQSIPDENSKGTNGNAPASSTGPNILFAYFVLKTIYSIVVELLLESTSSKNASIDPLSKHSTTLEEIIFQKGSMHPFATLFSVELLNRKMKMILTSNNDSMKYCLYDLLSMSLFTVLRSLQCIPISNMLNNKSPWTLTMMKPSWNQITTAEYYLVIKREKSLLQQLTYRMHYEYFYTQAGINQSSTRSSSANSSANTNPAIPSTVLNLTNPLTAVATNNNSNSSSSGLYSRYTRSIALLLTTWYDLRIQLHLFPYAIFTHYAFASTMTDTQTSLTTSYNHAGIIKVNQISSCSITISWKLPAETNQGEYNLYLVPLSTGIPNEAPVVVLEGLQKEGIYRVDELDGDSFYQVVIMSSKQHHAMYGNGNSSAIPSNDILSSSPLSCGNRDNNSPSNSSPSFHLFDMDITKRYTLENTSTASPQAAPEVHSSVNFSTPALLQLLVATDTEPILTFFPDAISPNIILSANTTASTTGASAVTSSPSSTHPTVTLRNVTNKKWSTARANIPLLHGVYKWEVLIDRCISKNIFIGVATKDCKLDNYVGCDAYGWAFLANKAIWHNKSKLKTYGDLFRTGDVISVVLDMDVGHLLFYLNDKCMGIAIENLVGPLYPAFSLYNEDDSLTILSMKSISSSTLAGDIAGLGSGQSNRWKGKFSSLSATNGGAGSFLAEYYLDRMHLLRNLMQFLISSHHMQSMVSNTTAYDLLPSKTFSSLISKEMLQEMFARYHAWVLEGNIYRSISYQGMIFLIQVSSTALTLFLTKAVTGTISITIPLPSGLSLRIMEVVRYERKYYRVIGVGAHRLWLQLIPTSVVVNPKETTATAIGGNGMNDDEYVPLTFDTYQMMLQKGILELNASFAAIPQTAKHIANDSTLIIRPMHMLSPLITATFTLPGGSLYNNNNSGSSLRMNFEHFQNCIQDQFVTWNALDDSILLMILYSYTSKYYHGQECDIFAISPSHCLDSLVLLQAHVMESVAIPTNGESNINIASTQAKVKAHFTALKWLPKIDELRIFFARHYNMMDILLRIYLWLCFNDLAGVVFPMIVPYDNNEEITTSLHNHPMDLLKELRPFLFPQVKDQWANLVNGSFNKQTKETCHTILQYYQGLPVHTVKETSSSKTEVDAKNSVSKLLVTPQKKPSVFHNLGTPSAVSTPHHTPYNTHYQTPTSSAAISAFHYSLNPNNPDSNHMPQQNASSLFSPGSVRGSNNTPLYSHTLPATFYQSTFPLFQQQFSAMGGLPNLGMMSEGTSFSLLHGKEATKTAEQSAAADAATTAHSAPILYYPLVIQQQLVMHITSSQYRYDLLRADDGASSNTTTPGWSMMHYLQSTYLCQFHIYLEQLSHFYMYQLSMDYQTLQNALTTLLPAGGNQPSTVAAAAAAIAASGLNSSNSRLSNQIISQLQALEHSSTLWEHLFRLANEEMFVSMWSFVLSNSFGKNSQQKMNLPFFIRGILSSSSITALPSIPRSSSSSLGVLTAKEKATQSTRWNYFESLLWKALYLSSSISNVTTGLSGLTSHYTTSGISEWTLLSLFVHSVCHQAQGLLDIFIQFENNTIMLDKYHANDMNSFIQSTHSLGMIIGLALRAGICLNITLPHSFYFILTSTKNKHTMKSNSSTNTIQDTFLTILALSLRMGITAMYPESVWNFWTMQEMELLFTGGVGSFDPPPSTESSSSTTDEKEEETKKSVSTSPIIPALYSLPHIVLATTYDPILHFEDAHIQNFWFAIYELSEAHRQILWKALFTSTTTTACLHVMKPTASACLSPDTTNIMIFPQLHGIAIPKYSNYSYMQLYIQQLIQSLLLH